MSSDVLFSFVCVQEVLISQKNGYDSQSGSGNDDALWVDAALDDSLFK